MAAHRDQVFVAGGQPTITYVEREEQHVERNLARALATPNQIVSLSGPTKTGKTVLCRRVLGQREYVWIDGGQIKNGDDLWDRVCSELSIPSEIETTKGEDDTKTIGISYIVTASGSQLIKSQTRIKQRVSSMARAISVLTERTIIMVIDDFHYMPAEARTEIMRNIKGAVFNGLKALLLSISHRAFDAIKAESELTGRFTAIPLPSWTSDELDKIPKLGFAALKVRYAPTLIQELTQESQESPFLMQKFCWEICFDCGVEGPKLLAHHSIPEDHDLRPMFIRIAKDAGLPIYQNLVAGPQSRKVRMKRPLRSGSEADIYEATLLALAETGPKASVSYEELRESLNKLLIDNVPQKHEITSALIHLSKIATKSGTVAAIDWDEGKREINIVDPYLRFFLRWQVRAESAL